MAFDTLRLLGCKAELLGLTTVGWRGGRSRERGRRRGSPRRPGRLCDLLHIVYRSADRAVAPSLRPMRRPGLHKENVDGEALDWAAGRLAGRPERRRVIVVVSDGAPVDDSTLDANGPDILMDHLREVIARLAGWPSLTLAAVSLGSKRDCLPLYPLSRIIRTPDDLGLDLMRALRDALVEGRPPGEGGVAPPAASGAMV